MISNRISKGITVALSSLVLLWGTAALTQSQANPVRDDGSMSNMSSAQAGSADQIFVRKAMQGGLAEVQLGRLATQKGGADVKQFGQMMVHDHTRLNDETMPIAAQIGVTPPANLTVEDQKLMEKLLGESGKQFDETYIRAMVADHRGDLKEFRHEAETTKSDSIKNIAASGQQVIQVHLLVIEQIAKTHHIVVPSR